MIHSAATLFTLLPILCTAPRKHFVLGSSIALRLGSWNPDSCNSRVLACIATHGNKNLIECIISSQALYEPGTKKVPFQSRGGNDFNTATIIKRL